MKKYLSKSRKTLFFENILFFFIFMDIFVDIA